MAILNKAILIGRLTIDPELRYTPTNTPVTSFGIAINRRFTKPGEQPVTDFLDIVCWRQQAEFVCKYFKKGQQICIIGAVQTSNWQDKEGNNRKRTEIVAEDVQFVDSKANSGGAASMPKAEGEPSFSNADIDDFKELGDEDDLPF